MRGASTTSPEYEKDELRRLKENDGFTWEAIGAVHEYSARHDIPKESQDLILYVILHTIRPQASNRCLPKAQAALRGLR